MTSDHSMQHLATLLANLAPELISGEFVFCTAITGALEDFSQYSPLATFQEAEGLTLVLSKESAERAGLSYEGLMRCITLTVHSSLEVVGLTAAVSSALADVGISANVVAAYYHDHVFVPEADAAKALALITQLQGSKV
jgi:hypothetical protein